MAKGIASPALVVRMARAGLLSFYGAGGQRAHEIDGALAELRAMLPPGTAYGVNLLHQPAPDLEEALVDRAIAREVPVAEASAFINVTPALVRLRLAGARRDPSGAPLTARRVLGKASRLEVIDRLLAPPPPELVAELERSGRLSADEAAVAPSLAMVDELCVEADSGGHTDRGVAGVLLPAARELRDAAAARYGYPRVPRVGLAGGLGTPRAVAAAFVLGAEFVLTGSINQCTVEAATSDTVKDMLAAADVHDVDLAPAGDMLEIGARIQVLRRGSLFAPRATKLYDTYRRCAGLDDIEAAARAQIERTILKRDVASVWDETRAYYAAAAPDELARAEANPKLKMSLVFRWYWIDSQRKALRGDPAERVDYQVWCGPAMGAFNRWARGTELEPWRNRHADEIARRLMDEAAALLHGAEPQPG